MKTLGGIFVLILIIFVISFLFYLEVYFYKAPKDKTTWEKIGGALGSYFQKVAGLLSFYAQRITEPASKRRYRRAAYEFAKRTTILFELDWYPRERYLKQKLRVDDSFKKSLEILELSEERWNRIALYLFYVGQIEQNSKRDMNYSDNNSSDDRKGILEKNYREEDKDRADYMKKALAFFNIPIEEWIRDGADVIKGHGLTDDEDWETYSQICDKFLKLS